MDELYFATEDTLFLKSESEWRTKIYEMNKTFSINQFHFSIIKDSCNNNRTSYENMVKYSQKLINKHYKLPVYLDKDHKNLFFPTKSNNSPNCYWISYQNLVSFVKKGSSTILVFKNNVKFKIPVSYNIINNQFSRCLCMENMTKLTSEKCFN